MISINVNILFITVLPICKMLPLEENGQRVCGLSLYCFFQQIWIYKNIQLSQEKKFNKIIKEELFYSKYVLANRLTIRDWKKIYMYMLH